MNKEKGHHDKNLSLDKTAGSRVHRCSTKDKQGICVGGVRGTAQSQQAEQDSQLSSTRLPDLEGQVAASFLLDHVSEKEPLAKCTSVSSTVGLSLSALFPVETRILSTEGSGGQTGSVTRPACQTEIETGQK